VPKSSPFRPASAPDWSVYALVAITWVATRVMAVVSVDMTPWMLNDLDIYLSWVPGLQSGVFPADDPTWQYPPGIGPLFVLSDSLGVEFRWGFTLVILAVDAALMGMLLVARARRSTASMRGPWLWAAAGLVVGPIMVTRFDVVPTALAALAVLLVARPILSGAAAALGAATKVWPAFMLIVLPRRSLPRGLLGFVITGATLLVAALVLGRDALSFLSNQQSRGLQVESVGALPYEVWSLLGNEVSFRYQYGSIQVDMAGAETVGLVVTVVGVLLLGGLLVARLAGRLEAAAPGDVALTVMLVSVATSRVYSPQFNVWLVGLATVALLDSRTRLRAVVAIVVVVSVLTQVVYPWSATQLVSGDAFTIAVQALRIVGLILAAALGLRAILQRPTAVATGMVG
jgi:hypothetical protein